MTQEERFDLLKNACEGALQYHREENVDKKICISPLSKEKFYIIISKDLRWKHIAEYIVKRIKEKNNNISISQNSNEKNFVGITVTFPS